mmetsp:Transcript_42945/g.104771  ORF Transcript_42945/g.104771 Transcript_42945/m.104771 type:complete len:350 (+) Transcript_42945:1628-2677(+)
MRTTPRKVLLSYVHRPDPDPDAHDLFRNGIAVCFRCPRDCLLTPLNGLAVAASRIEFFNDLGEEHQHPLLRQRRALHLNMVPGQCLDLCEAHGEVSDAAASESSDPVNVRLLIKSVVGVRVGDGDDAPKRFVCRIREVGLRKEECEADPRLDQSTLGFRVSLCRTRFPPLLRDGLCEQSIRLIVPLHQSQALKLEQDRPRSRIEHVGDAEVSECVFHVVHRDTCLGRQRLRRRVLSTAALSAEELSCLFAPEQRLACGFMAPFLVLDVLHREVVAQGAELVGEGGWELAVVDDLAHFLHDELALACIRGDRLEGREQLDLLVVDLHLEPQQPLYCILSVHAEGEGLFDI